MKHQGSVGGTNNWREATHELPSLWRADQSPPGSCSAVEVNVPANGRTS